MVRWQQNPSSSLGTQVVSTQFLILPTEGGLPLDQPIKLLVAGMLPMVTHSLHAGHVYSNTHSKDGLYAVSGYKDRLALSSSNPVFHQKSIVSHPSLRLTISISISLRALKMEQSIFGQ